MTRPQAAPLVPAPRPPLPAVGRQTRGRGQTRTELSHLPNVSIRSPAHRPATRTPETRDGSPASVGPGAAPFPRGSREPLYPHSPKRCQRPRLRFQSGKRLCADPAQRGPCPRGGAEARAPEGGRKGEPRQPPVTGRRQRAGPGRPAAGHPAKLRDAKGAKLWRGFSSPSRTTRRDRSPAALPSSARRRSRTYRGSPLRLQKNRTEPPPSPLLPTASAQPGTASPTRPLSVRKLFPHICQRVPRHAARRGKAAPGPKRALSPGTPAPHGARGRKAEGPGERSPQR